MLQASKKTIIHSSHYRIKKTVSKQPSTEIKCTDCGKIATVPFKPTAGEPVYCRECFAKNRTHRTETRKGPENKPQSQNVEKQAWSRREETGNETS